jgi:hypothetical protein
LSRSRLSKCRLLWFSCCQSTMQRKGKKHFFLILIIFLKQKACQPYRVWQYIPSMASNLGTNLASRALFFKLLISNDLQSRGGRRPVSGSYRAG